jgi:hypothetical protein
MLCKMVRHLHDGNPVQETSGVADGGHTEVMLRAYGKRESMSVYCQHPLNGSAAHLKRDSMVLFGTRTEWRAACNCDATVRDGQGWKSVALTGRLPTPLEQ